MIHNDQELKVTQDRIAYFLDLRLVHARVAGPMSWHSFRAGTGPKSNACTRDVLDYLTRAADRTAVKAG